MTVDRADAYRLVVGGDGTLPEFRLYGQKDFPSPGSASAYTLVYYGGDPDLYVGATMR